MKFHLLLSGDSETADSGVVGVDVALSERSEVALAVSRQCAMKLRGLRTANSSCSDRHNMFVVSARSPTECSPERVNDALSRERHHDFGSG